MCGLRRREGKAKRIRLQTEQHPKASQGPDNSMVYNQLQIHAQIASQISFRIKALRMSKISFDSILKRIIISDKMGAREQTIRISIFFFLIFTPYSSYMTILTHIYEQAGLPGIGPATLASNYIAFIISTILAPACPFTLKTQLLLGGFFYTFNYSSGIFASMTDNSVLKFTISCLGSGVAGLSAGLLWVSQGRYIHLACLKFKALSRKGEMFGIFSSLYCFSNVSAGLITTFGLGFFQAQAYFFIITAMGALAFVFCLIFVNNIEFNESQVALSLQKNQNAEAAAPAQSLLSQTDPEIDFSPVEALGFQQAAPQLQAQTLIQPKKYNAWQAAKSTFSFVPSMYPIILFLVVDGISLGIYSSEITHLIPSDVDPDSVNKIAGIAMITLGVGSILGGFLSGKISDKLGTINAGRLAICFFLGSCCCFLSALYLQLLWLTFLAAFVWGYSLFYIEGWMFVVCSRSYKGEARAFSVNKQLHAIFYLLFQIAAIVTDNQLPLLAILIGTATICFPAVMLLNKVPTHSD